MNAVLIGGGRGGRRTGYRYIKICIPPGGGEGSPRLSDVRDTLRHLNYFYKTNSQWFLFSAKIQIKTCNRQRIYHLKTVSVRKKNSLIHFAQASLQPPTPPAVDAT
jgi:hypothetical protein